MRVIALILAVSAVALARPQFQLSDKGYEGLQAALDGRIPVAISSGQLLYSAVDVNSNNFVNVDLTGAGGAVPVAGGAAPAPLPTTLIRTDPSLADAVARSGVIAVDDLVVIAPAAPEEAFVAPAQPVAVVVSAVARRKRQVPEEEEEETISNAREIGNALSSLGGLFGSTVGRFLDSVAAATVEMVDGVEGLGTLAIDQVENRFDGNPDNDFFRR